MKNSKNLNKKPNKMKKLLTPCVIVLIGIFFAACEKVIDPGDLPQQDARLVFNSIIYTDSVIKANISSSKSILSGKPYVFIDNAVIELFEDDLFLQTLVNKKNGNYLSSVNAKSNKKYTVKVSAPNYNSITASTTLLGNISVSSITKYDTSTAYYSLDSYGGDQKFIYGATNYKIKIIDDLTKTNYYGIRPIIEIYDDTGQKIEDSGITATVQRNSGDNTFNNGGYNAPFIDIDDQTLVNGKEIDVDLSVLINGSFDSDLMVGSIKIFLELYNINEDFYKYRLTLNDQTNTNGSFFSEPVMVYSNVSNGMGIFAGANLNTVFINTAVPKE
jgi:hypothetical protein